MFRTSPSDVFSNKGSVQIRSEPTGEQTRRSAIPTNPLCNFIEITPMHRCVPKILITPAKHVSTREQLCETAPLCQISFKRLKLEKVIIYNC